MIQYIRMLRNVVIVLVFVGALFVIASQPPEQVFARSEDGVVVLEGVSRSIHSVSIDVIDTVGVPLDGRLSSYYLLIPDVAGLAFQPTVTVNAQDKWGVGDDAHVFVFHDANTGWVAQKTVSDRLEKTWRSEIDLSKPVVIAVGIP